MNIPGSGGLSRQLMKQMEKLQRDIAKTQEELGAMRVEASAGGGAVSATANGLGDLVEVRIAAEAVDPNDVEMLEDLVVAAVREAIEKGRKLQEERLGGLAGRLGIPGLF